MSLLNRLPLTRIKIGIARVLYQGLPPGYRRRRHRITRGGIRYEVDLSEGIDLSLFLFGGFQKHVTHSRFATIPDDAVILDVGANAGVMTLQFAQRAPRGHVYAFEPTHFACERLRTNLGLNPDLAARITAIQTFVSARGDDPPAPKVFASWKVDGSRDGDRHPVHLGTAVSAEGVGAVTLDGFAAAQGLSRVDLIKIDTDGHELEVLKGAAETLKRFRPAVIFEVGLYVMEERGIGFAHYEELFRPLGYRLLDSKTGREITAANHRAIIPAQGTLDALALPSAGAGGAVDHDRLVHKIGRPVTLVLLSPRLRESRLARAAYTWMYLLGKTLAESREKRFLRGLVEPGMVVFDVGANLGFYTLFLAARVGPAGRVHAFEPDPVSCGILQRRAARHLNITATQAAAGDHSGRATLFCNRLNRADNRVHAHQGDVPLESLEVPLLRLDDYCEAHGIDRIDALKMDVQGAEVTVLEGFRQTLARTPPRWMLIEFAPQLLRGAGSSPEAFWAILQDLGFEPWGFDESGKAFRIEDTGTFSLQYEDGYTDVWAKRKPPSLAAPYP